MAATLQACWSRAATAISTARTQQGGASGGGTVYSITATGTLTTLASFDDAAGGGFPYAGLALGNGRQFLRHHTLFGGADGEGTVFRVTRAGVLKSLYSFTNGTDGGQPLAGLALGTDGNFYGTAFSGGGNGLGTVFRLRVIQTSSQPDRGRNADVCQRQRREERISRRWEN